MANLLATFSIGSKQDFQVANLPLASVNFDCHNDVLQEVQGNESMTCTSWHEYVHRLGNYQAIMLHRLENFKIIFLCVAQH